jgi:uncharacterized integral membrane protein
MAGKRFFYQASVFFSILSSVSPLEHVLVDCRAFIFYDSACDSGGAMWILKSALLVIVFLAFLGFSFQNAYQVTTVNIASTQYNSVPLIVVLYVAFAIGVIFWFVVSIFQYLRSTSQISDLKRKNRQLLEEIKALRNLPLEEITAQDLNSENRQDKFL